MLFLITKQQRVECSGTNIVGSLPFPRMKHGRRHNELRNCRQQISRQASALRILQAATVTQGMPKASDYGEKRLLLDASSQPRR
jgi:hypothetical protein